MNYNVKGTDYMLSSYELESRRSCLGPNGRCGTGKVHANGPRCEGGNGGRRPLLWASKLPTKSILSRGAVTNETIDISKPFLALTLALGRELRNEYT